MGGSRGIVRQQTILEPNGVTLSMDLPVRTNRGVQGLEGRVRLGVTRPVLHLPSIVHSVLVITELSEVVSEVVSEEGSVGMETVVEIQEDLMEDSTETMVDSTVTMVDSMVVSMETMGDSMVVLEVEVLLTADMDKTVM